MNSTLTLINTDDLAAAPVEVGVTVTQAHNTGLPLDVWQGWMDIHSAAGGALAETAGGRDDIESIVGWAGVLADHSDAVIAAGKVHDVKEHRNKYAVCIADIPSEDPSFLD